MKNWYIYILMLIFGMGCSACDDNEPDKDNSIFDTSEAERNAFDKWLKVNYVDTYNIDFIYRMEHIESDYSHNLVPTDFKLSVKLAKIVKHAWLEVYDEVGGIDFTRANAPKVIHLIGSASWDKTTYTLGTAEGGLKVTLYMGNWLDPTNVNELNEYYFKVMHHEFAHILHQKKAYTVEFDKISAGNYVPTGWQNRSLETVAPLGFVTPYAGSQPREDIAEVTACYLTYPAEQWNEVISLAGEKGSAIIYQKLDIVRKYMKESWAIDIEQLRSVISRRCAEINELDLDNI